jgi:hypothetical protein
MKEYLLIKNPTKITYTVSIFAIIVIFIALGIFCYYYKFKNYNDDPDFTISDALMHANKPGAIAFFILELFTLIYLHYLRGNKIILYFGSALVTILLSFLITMLWITPEYDPDLHITLAGIAFGVVLTYNLTTLYILYKNYKNLALLITLIVLNVGFALSLIIVVSSPSITQHILEHDFNNVGKYEMLFAISEIFVVLLFMFTILLLGFYRSKNLHFEEKIKKVKKIKK